MVPRGKQRALYPGNRRSLVERPLASARCSRRRILCGLGSSDVLDSGLARIALAPREKARGRVGLVESEDDRALDDGHGLEQHRAEGLGGSFERLSGRARELERQRRARQGRHAVQRDRRGQRRRPRVIVCARTAATAGHKVRVVVARWKGPLSQGYAPREFAPEMLDGADKGTDRPHYPESHFVNFGETERRIHLRPNRPIRSSNAA